MADSVKFEPKAVRLPATFRASPHTELRRNRPTKRSLNKYMEAVVLEIVRETSPEYVRSLKDAIKDGKPWAMNMFATLTNLIKSEAGVVINMQQNNVAPAALNTRNFDSIIRQLDSADRGHAENAIDVTPVAELPAGKT